MIHAGVNHRPQDNPVYVANKICRLMVHTSEESPNTLIYFSAIFPNFGRSFNSMINYGNNEVFNFCLDNQKMKFIQYSNFAVNHNLNYDYFWKNKIHKTHASNISLRQLTTRLYFKYKGKVRRVFFCFFLFFLYHTLKWEMERQQYGLKVVLWDVIGFSEENVSDDLLQNEIRKYDILFLGETWQYKDKLDNLHLPLRYFHDFVYRKNFNTKGVLPGVVYYRCEIQGIDLAYKSSENIICIKIDKGVNDYEHSSFVAF